MSSRSQASLKPAADVRVAFLSDIHGNEVALREVLTYLQRLHVDQIVIGGDVVDPLPGSQRVAESLLATGYPMIRGNHEDYVIAAATEPESAYALEPNWAPVRQVARELPSTLIAKLAAWPLSFRVHDKKAGDLLFCHASPGSNRTGWFRGIDEELAAELAAAEASTIVCGHWHFPRSERWLEKTLIINGSVGVPLHGRAEAEFTILDSASGTWKPEPHLVRFDAMATCREYLDSGWFKAGGPMAWLILDELRVHHHRMGRFFEWMKEVAWSDSIRTEDGLREATRDFLRALGTWNELTRLAGRPITG